MPAQPVRPPASAFDHVQEAPQWGGYWGTGDRDLLIGTDTGEEFTGEGGDDFVDAGGGDDRIHAGAGDDGVLAGGGDDFVTGDDGNDWLEGGAGQDTIYAGAGDDTLSGGAGDGDVLSGGNGADTYVFRRGDGRDSVEGFFRADGDRLDLTDFASVLGDIDSFAKLKAAGRVTGTDPWGGDTIIRLTDTDVVTLRWVNPRDLTDEQFVFAAAPPNCAPTDILLSAAGIAENAAPGAVVGTLSAVDPDAGDTVRFSLLDDAGGAFALAEDGRTLVALRSFDYEAGPSGYAVTVRATDAGGLTTDKVLTIAVLNVDEAVTAEADRYAAVEDTVLTVSAEEGVLANDRAPDGGRAALAGTITTALGGTVDLAADGSFTYTPKANANGRDGFTYTLTDVDGSTATGAVTLDVAAVQDPIAPIRLADVAVGKGGFAISRETGGIWQQARWIKQSTSGVGDVNGDGFADVIVSARNYLGGAAYVVFGKEDKKSVDLKDVAAGQGGVKIGDENRHKAGGPVSAAGDVNNDGLADIFLGGTGTAFLVYGKSDGGAVKLEEVAEGRGGFKILGEPEIDDADLSVTVIGDVNGDDRVDFLVNASYNMVHPKVSAAYIVFGKDNTTSIDLKDVAAGTGGFKIVGENEKDSLGSSVSAAGDVNGDKIDDFIIGAPWASSAYVLFGKEDITSIDFKDIASGAGGFKIIGENEGDLAGWSVSAADDINGDGRSDFIVSAILNKSDNNTNGAVYVVFGKEDTKSVELKDVAVGRGGFKIVGEYLNDVPGWSVSGRGDFNGDGLGDLLISSRDRSSLDRRPTSSYIVFGKSDTNNVNLGDISSGYGGMAILNENKSPSELQSEISSVGDINHDGLIDIAIGISGVTSNGSYFIDGAYVLFGSRDWLA